MIIKQVNKIVITENYNNDLALAIKAGVLPKGAKPKKKELYEAIVLHNEQVELELADRRDRLADKKAAVSGLTPAEKPVQTAPITETEQIPHDPNPQQSSDDSPKPNSTVSKAKPVAAKQTAASNSKVVQISSAPTAAKNGEKLGQKASPAQAKGGDGKDKEVKQIDIKPGTYAKMPRPGCVRRRFIDALAKGSTAAELKALIPPTNKATVNVYCQYIGSLGFGVKQEGDTYRLVMPKTVDDVVVPKKVSDDASALPKQA
jgi:hypothetical protein